MTTGITWNLWTVLLVVGIVLIVSYEIYAAIRRSPMRPTVTGIVQHLSRRPAVPFFFGLLMGHLFL